LSLFGTTYHKKSDEELMELIKENNQKAFGELYDRYAERLINYFYRMLWKDQEKAEDFTQDLFTKIIQKPELFNGSRAFKTWVFSVANNMCKNEYRHHEVKKKANDHFDYNVSRSAASKAVEDMDKITFNQELEVALSSLDEAKRSTFELRYNDDMSIKEIADTFGCSEGTVKSRLFYTLKHLNTKLKAFEGVIYILFWASTYLMEL